MPRVIVTRPAREAQAWVRQLAARGLAALALPLIEIAPEPMAGTVLRAREHLGDFDAAMFVSGNAVTSFLESNGPPALDGLALNAIQTRAWSPGPGTSAALRRAGWPEARIDEPAADAAQFDSEALWQRVAAQVSPGLCVLIVRGGDAQGAPAGRAWLAERLVAAGAQVEQVVAYRRRAPRWDVGQCEQASAASTDASVWLFSSSEAIANLRRVLPAQNWGRARALATHPRIAQAAREAGFGAVHETRPALADVVASIESLT